MPIAIGTRLGPYKVTAAIGAGGMGEVYRARDSKLGRDVALKVLPDRLAHDSDYMARFTREARVLASLNHPRIAAIYGVEERALVLELVEGPTLADRISRGRLPEAEALPLIHQLIDALEYAHEHGVVHRDLKPANIKLTGDGDLKLLDFGLAKAAETQPAQNPVNSPTMTIAASMPGVIMGTAGFMSPEQARGARVDHRTDIWAFGVVVYEMLTATQAFSGATMSDILASILKTDPDLSKAPAKFRLLLTRCLERDVRKRLGWIGDARWLLAEPAAPKAARPARWVAATLVCAALAGAAGFGVSRLKTPASTSAPRATKLNRVTTGGTSMMPAISPDGKLVAYIGPGVDGTGGFVWVQQTGGGKSVAISEGLNLGPGSPVFSADGTRVYFRVETPAPGIYEAAVLGGEGRLLIADPKVFDVAPSPDGKWLAYASTSNILLRNIASGETRRLFDTRTSQTRPPVWSPDSTRLLTYRFKERGSWEGVAVPIDGSAPVVLPAFLPNLSRQGFTDPLLTRILAWLPGDLVVFSAILGDAHNIWSIPLAEMGTGRPSPVIMAPWTNFMASVQGNHLAFANLRTTNQVWSLPADLNAGKVLGEPERVTADLIEAQFPDIHPDGTTLAYISRKFGGQGVFVLNLKTGKERMLYMSEANSAYTTFSPDGTKIAFGRSSPQLSTVVIPTAGGEAKGIGSASGRIRGWTRDGRYLLVWRFVPSGLDRIGVMEVATGKVSETLIAPEEPAIAPRLSPDNRWVAFQTRSEEGWVVWLAPFRGAQPVPQADWIRIRTGGENAFWSPDSRSVYYLARASEQGSSFELMRQAIDENGKPTKPAAAFYSLAGKRFGGTLLNTVSVTRDKMYFLLTAGQSDIWVTTLGN